MKRNAESPIELEVKAVKQQKVDILPHKKPDGSFCKRGLKGTKYIDIQGLEINILCDMCNQVVIQDTRIVCTSPIVPVQK